MMLRGRFLLSFHHRNNNKDGRIQNWLTRARRGLSSSGNNPSNPAPTVTEVQLKPAKDRLLNVALIGRPNVGKSTLFNRFTKSSKAIVSNIPGTTRDRKEGRGQLAGIPFTVIDTGGLEDSRGELNQLIQQQVEIAALQADVVLFIIDGREGITPTDEHYAKWLRNKIYKSRALADYKPPKVLLALNKTEGARLADQVMDTFAESAKLGFGEALLISGAHGDGMGEIATTLLEIIREKGLPEEDPEILTNLKSKPKLNHRQRKAAGSVISSQLTSIDTDENLRNESVSAGGNDEPLGAESRHLADNEAEFNEKEIQEIEKEMEKIRNFEELKDKTIQVAIMGRPNVGKSTLLNAIIGEERVLTGPLPGLTRDAIEVEWRFKDRQFRLVDTAGLTRVHTNRSLLGDIKVKAHQTIGNVLRQSIKEAKVKLPGKEMIEHIDDVPSQFSEQISEFALMSAFNALRYAQVVFIVVESLQGKFLKLDLQLAKKCLEEGRSIVIVANKADLVTANGISLELYENQVKQHIDGTFRDFGSVPIIACSAIEKKGINKVLNTAIKVHDAYSKRIPTWILNRWLKELIVTAPTARFGTKPIRAKYMTQLKVRPPTFALFANVPQLPGFLEKFYTSRLQTDFSLSGIPVRLEIRKTKGNPVKKHLLKQGKHTRRGTGLGERRGKVGKDRVVKKRTLQRRKKIDERRRRDTRIRRKRRS